MFYGVILGRAGWGRAKAGERYLSILGLVCGADIEGFYLPTYYSLRGFVSTRPISSLSFEFGWVY